MTSEGCVEALDRLSLKFLDAPPGRRLEVLVEAEEVAAKQRGFNKRTTARAYVKVMKRYMQEGFGFILDEQRRVHNLLKAKVGKKEGTLMTYLHILRFFENHRKPYFPRDEL